MKRILLGGSPCTHWSIAQKRENRETAAQGLGWELFLNYVIALEKFKPDFFLYENNESISQEIQGEIEKYLDIALLHFNSAKVSAQTRKRVYGTNIEGVKEPADRKIYVRDILQREYKAENLYNEIKFTEPRNKDTSRIIRIGTIGKGGQGERVYSIDGKSSTLSANGGGRGAKTGLYLVDNDTVRKLNPIEAERLQTMPDNYTEGIPNTQRYKCVGNGWTAEMIIHILSFMNIPLDEEIEVVALYDGIGTGRYCLDKLGYTKVKYYAYEIDKYAMQIANKNYPDIVQCGDAFKVREKDWAAGV